MNAESEFGIAAAHIDSGNIHLLADGKITVVAGTDRIFLIVNFMVSGYGQELSMRQIDEGRRSFCAASSDNRYVITAECDMFGGLATRCSSVGAMKQTPPRIGVSEVSTTNLNGHFHVEALCLPGLLQTTPSHGSWARLVSRHWTTPLWSLSPLCCPARPLFSHRHRCSCHRDVSVKINNNQCLFDSGVKIEESHPRLLSSSMLLS
jgi:hypothetical protein